MSGEDIKLVIEQAISHKVGGDTPSLYKSPIVGYARASDPIFAHFKNVIHDKHLLPSDLLPEAKTVLAFFLPYKEEIIKSNREGSTASRQWAEAYDSTNRLIGQICAELQETLAEQGIKSGWLLPTYHFDKEKLMAQWSHRHSAYACGLGTFGRNNLLITPKGCAGRFGTMVLAVDLEPSPRSEHIHQCNADSGCTYCQKKCPVQALSELAFDRHRCYAHCQANDHLFPDLETVEVCGKCATGPCATKR